MAPYKEGKKIYTKKITYHGHSKWVRAKTKAEVEAKAKAAKKALIEEVDRLEELTERKTVEDLVEEWIEWRAKKKKWKKKHKRGVESTCKNWIVPDPALGAADCAAYHREKHIRTSNSVFSANSKPHDGFPDKAGTNRRRRKIDEKMEAEREERLAKAEPRPSLRGMYADEVTHKDLEAIVDGQADGDYSYSSVKKTRDTLVLIFKYAKSEGYISENPAEGLELPGGLRKGTHRMLTQVEAETALKVAKKHRGGIFVLIMLFCGLRPQEVAALQWDDVDLDARKIHVKKALVDYSDIDKTKTRAGTRTVPIPSYLYDVLNSMPDKIGYVWTDTDGEPANTTNVNNMWKSFKNAMHKEVGAKKFRGQIIESKIGNDLTLYDFRHTYATLITKRAEVKPEAAKDIMGHSEYSTTADIYAAHEDEKALDKAARQIDTMYKDFVADMSILDGINDDDVNFDS